ncbi:MAG: hypothetical protein HYX42_18715, partial [Polaromonas sp.]|uniref:calcium-binding protein n=1 Tax=Polaromonas sp. TaxID=1869339 RepID=UPI0025ECBEBC
MKQIESAYINALLADAAYRPVTEGMTQEQLLGELESRMTLAQATFLASNFDVLNSIETPTPLGPGFDAVIWRGKSGTEYEGQTYVSMRGTQGAADLADDVSLAATGVPKDQIVAMVNWWLRITAPESATVVRQIQYGATTIDPVTGEVISDNAFSLVAEPIVRTGPTIDVSTITGVNGHSLGGYLATTFTRLFGNQFGVQAVSTFNSAGFSNVAALNVKTSFDQIAQLLGLTGSFNEVAAKQANYYAQNGISLTTNSVADAYFLAPGFNQYGGRVALNQEGLSTEGASNHAMYKQTDLLALGVALEKLDGSMTFAKLNDIIRAGSNNVKASYEGVLDSVRSMVFGVGNFTATLVGDIGPDNAPNRVDYHEKLDELIKANAFQVLSGKVTISLAGSNLATQAKARIGFEEIATLQTLSPFVLSPVGQDGINAIESLWQSAAWGDKYHAWLADKASLQAGHVASNYTDKWIADRAAMLSVFVDRNNQDIASGLLLQGRESVDYSDAESGQTLAVRVGVPNSGTVARKVIFGNDAVDILEGESREDDLYGGAGNDFIDGKGGADYLEGNAGTDSLYGGDGNDTLLGGSDDDQLSGEAGNDILEGGAGSDSYRFEGPWGKDTITDSDNSGRILIDGNAATGGKTTGYRNVWQARDAEGNYLNYAVYDDSASSTGKRLVITKGTDQANTITVNNFDYAAATGGAGYLGIKLDATQRLIIKEGSGANAWNDLAFDPASLQGQGSTIQKGGGKAYTAYLASAAKAGDTITLSFSGSGADKL